MFSLMIATEFDISHSVEANDGGEGNPQIQSERWMQIREFA